MRSSDRVPTPEGPPRRPRPAVPATSDGSPSRNDILAALQCRIQPVRVSGPYLLALATVAAVMALLPLVYLCLIGLAGLGVYWHAVHNTWIITSSAGGYSPRVVVGKLILYAAPLVAGGIAVLFMLKPLIARRAVAARSFEVSPKREPFLYNVVQALCRAVGAPPPRRIWLCLDANAAAGLGRGVLGFLGRDVSLTLGIPLIAGMDIGPFLGVVSHELGHLSQGTAMRCSYVIRSVNAWFARVVYERDALDVMLRSAASESDIRIGVLFHLARLAVWLSRRILWVLMIFGHAVSCLLLRQMEYNADRYALGLVGSRCYVDAMVRGRLLALLTDQAYGAMGPARDGQRVEDFAAALAMAEQQLTPEVRRRIEEACNAQRTEAFDTHPAMRDRIQHAVQRLNAGVFAVQGPARRLFVDFDSTAREAIRDQNAAAWAAFMVNRLEGRRA